MATTRLMSFAEFEHLDAGTSRNNIGPLRPAPRHRHPVWQVLPL